jgi:hypothetical protein
MSQNKLINRIIHHGKNQYASMRQRKIALTRANIGKWMAQRKIWRKGTLIELIDFLEISFYSPQLPSDQVGFVSTTSCR